MEAIGTDMTSRLSAMNVIFVAIVAQLNFVTGIGNTAIEAVAAADIIYAAQLGHEGLAPAFRTGSHGPLASVPFDLELTWICTAVLHATSPDTS